MRHHIQAYQLPEKVHGTGVMENAMFRHAGSKRKTRLTQEVTKKFPIQTDLMEVVGIGLSAEHHAHDLSLIHI